MNVELRDTAGTSSDTPGVNRKDLTRSKLIRALAASRIKPAAIAEVTRSDPGFDSQITAANPATIRWARKSRHSRDSRPW